MNTFACWRRALTCKIRSQFVSALAMGATNLAATTSSQWMFPLSALHSTPSRATSNIPLEKELYDRSRGVEFLYRLGVSLGLFV